MRCLQVAAGIGLTLVLLLTSCWDTAFWEDDECIDFTAKLVSVETQRVNLVGDKYLKLKFDDGETYGVREYGGQLVAGTVYKVELCRSYKLWSITKIEVYEGTAETE